MKDFIAIDGEAIAGKYVLLGTNIEGLYLYKPAGLSTISCLDFLWSLRKLGIIVGFGLHYDVNQIVKDLSDTEKDLLFEGLPVWYSGFELRYLHKRILTIKKDHQKLEVNDTFGFFQRSFIKTVEMMLVERDITFLQTYKDMRGSFVESDIKNIIRYNRFECELLVIVMRQLRTMLEVNNIKLRSWYGASCVATYMLNKFKVKKDYVKYSTENSPAHLMDALGRAYFGGRIEALKLGAFKNVIDYDINSSYPAAMLCLPQLRLDNYYRTNFLPRNGFGLYKIEWKTTLNIGPFPWRDIDGSIYYPKNGIGWYWQPEIEATMNSGVYIKVIEGYVWDCRPALSFQAIQNVYDQRKKLKVEKNGAEYALKLGMNALYGKFAQRYGKARYRNLAYAGFITSFTRAKLFRAVQHCPDGIIGFSTDGITSLQELDLPISDKLGEWSAKEYQNCNYIAPGIYRLHQESEVKVGLRGFGKWDWGSVLDQLNEKGSAQIDQKFFITWKLAQKTVYQKDYLQFIDIVKTLNPAGIEKRHYYLDDIKDWRKDHCESRLLDIPWTESALPKGLADLDMLEQEELDVW